jgi:biotin transport system substrate-specific component
MTSMTYADILRPATRERALAYDAALVLGGSVALALSAKVSVPFFPVPLTAQTLVVLLLGALLGARRGAMAVVAYLAEGACGLPVFAGPLGGLAYFSATKGMTLGYLAGFVGAAWVTGCLAERGWDRRTWTTVLAMLAGDAVLFAAGVAWLSTLIGVRAALWSGLVVCLPGEALKIAAATLALPTGWRLLGRTGLGR